MTTGLVWRYSPRVNLRGSFVEQLGRNDDSSLTEPAVAKDLFFGPDTTANFTGAFTINGASNAAFASQPVFGPSPGVTPTQWFRRDDVQRVVLVEIDYYTQVGSGLSAVPTLATRYLATAAYFDDQNSRIYRDCVIAIPTYRRSLDRTKLRGRFTATMGTMSIANGDGAFDDLLAIACDGSETRFYMGELDWTRDQFIYMFSATPTKIEATDRATLDITLKDNSFLLDVPIGGTQTVGGSGANANQIRPYLLGFAHNVECVLEDYAMQKYVHSENRLGQAGPTQVIPGGSGVRDQGVNVGFEDDNDGSVRLHIPPLGTVTADVLRLGSGRSPLATDYMLLDTPNTAFRLSNIFHEIYVNTYGFDNGPMSAKFRGALPSYFQGSLNDYFVGFVLTQSTNLWSDLTELLCDTGNCFVAIQRDGYVVFGRIRPDALAYYTATGTLPVAATISLDDIIGAQVNQPAPIAITKLEPTYYAVQGVGNKNWILQSSFAGSVAANVQALYRRDGYSTTSYVGEDGITVTAYLGSVSNVLLKTSEGGAPQKYHQSMTLLNGQDTLISCYSDRDCDTMLQAWSAVRRAQFLPWTEYADFATDLSFFQLEIGDVVNLTLTDANGNAVLGLGNTMAQVVDIDIDLTGGQIALGLAYRRPAIATY